MQELLFTGHDTITAAMNAAVMYIGRRPDVLAKIRHELDSQGFMEEQTLSLQKLTQLPYILNVVREVMRLAPSVGAVYRRALKTFEVGVCIFYMLNNSILTQ